MAELRVTFLTLTLSTEPPMPLGSICRVTLPDCSGHKMAVIVPLVNLLSVTVLARFGGEFLVRGGRMEVLEGTWAYPRGVIIRFPDRETAKRWHESTEYGKIKKLRHASATANMIVVDGIDAGQ